MGGYAPAATVQDVAGELVIDSPVDGMVAGAIGGDLRGGMPGARRRVSMVGTGRFELPACRLGGGRSIQTELRAHCLFIVAARRYCDARIMPLRPMSLR